MMRSMFAGVLRAETHQTRMDVIGNNIANVNTVGYKAARVTLKTCFTNSFLGPQLPLTLVEAPILSKLGWGYLRLH